MWSKSGKLGGNRMLAGLILIVCGVCVALFGYQIYRYFIFFQGFVAGAVIGGIIGRGILLSVLLGLVLGIVLGIMAVVLLRLGVFLQCAVSTFCVLFIPRVTGKIMGLLTWQKILALVHQYYVTGEIDLDFREDLIVSIGIGVIAGIIGLIFMRTMIILLTSLAGGAAAGMGIMVILKGIVPQLAVILGIALAIGGIIYQYSAWQKKEEADDDIQTVAQAVPLEISEVQPAAEIPLQPVTDTVRYCGYCGTKMSGAAKFCPKCGKPQ